MEKALAILRQFLAEPQKRKWIAAGSGALAVLLIATTALALTMRPDPSQTHPATARTAATATYTATVPPTNTPKPTATAKPTRAPVYIPPPKPKFSAPPPPPPPPLPPPPPATPTVTLCPTPTPTATPTTLPTATSTSTATATATATGMVSPVPSTTAQRSANVLFAPLAVNPCQSCPYYAGNNPSQSQIAAAISTASSTYGLPVNLVRAVAWQESKWHEDVTSCDGGVGLMQIQYYYADYFNSLNFPVCGLSTTSYNIYDLQGNANLGAKYLAYLKCYWTFGGPYSGTPSAPATYSSQWYYQQAGLGYPDTSSASSFCAAVYNDPNQPQYKAMPLSAPADWSCPYTPTTGDNTILELTLSAYNQGAGAVIKYGIQNGYYVQAVEGYIPLFYNGSLP